MTIQFACSCGKTLKAPDQAAGKRARCPACGAVVPVPAPVVTADILAGDASDNYELKEPPPRPAARPASSPIPPVRLGASPAKEPVLVYRPGFLQRYGYLLLLLALIPLIISVFHPAPSVDDQLEQTVKAHPEMPDLEHNIASLISDDGDLKVSEDKFFAVLPGERLEGYLFAHHTHGHWLLALAAAVAYLAFLVVCFPGSTRFIKGLLFAGIFTGTIGILILIFFQWAAVFTPVTFRVGGVVGLVLLIIKFIGYSYALADSNAGFLLSFVGFTCGVGLCEEVTKVIPLLFRVKPVPGEDDPTWHSLLLWGLASGVGFGIAEGIMYSGRYYNGIGGIEIYAVRFLSCVVLHAMWAGANGIALYRRQGDLEGADNNWAYAFVVLQIVWVPMVLHGLYDTLLKKDYELLALAVAFASFGWLAWQIERANREEPPLEKLPA